MEFVMNSGDRQVLCFDERGAHSMLILGVRPMHPLTCDYTNNHG